MSSKTIGVIGLGIMGAPMAANLVRAGFDVVGYNRSAAPMEALAAAGGRKASTIADLTAQSHAVLTVLPDGPDVQDVVLGHDGVVANARPQQLFIDFSTIRPETSRAISAAARAAGMRPLDAPVSGGQRGAVDATLSIMIGGDANDVAAARPILDAVGKTIVHVGPDGAGQTVKAANQLIVAGNIALVAEALVLLEANGVDTTSALSVLSGGLAGSRVLDQKGPMMLGRGFPPGFRIDLHHKDMGIAVSVARDANVALPLTGVVAQLVAAARAQGLGSLDHAALFSVIERLAGRGTNGTGE